MVTMLVMMMMTLFSLLYCHVNLWIDLSMSLLFDTQAPFFLRSLSKEVIFFVYSFYGLDLHPQSSDKVQKAPLLHTSKSGGTPFYY